MGRMTSTAGKQVRRIGCGLVRFAWVLARVLANGLRKPIRNILQENRDLLRSALGR
jgi:hypothetical protein